MNQGPARRCASTEWKKLPGSLQVRDEITEKGEKYKENELVSMIKSYVTYRWQGLVLIGIKVCPKAAFEGRQCIKSVDI